MSYYRLIRPGLLASVIALLVMTALSLWAYGQLPDRVPIHWNAAGEADGWGSRTDAVILMPLCTLGIALLLALAPLLEPRKAHLARSARPYAITWTASVALFTVMHVLVLFTADSADALPVGPVVIAASGGLLVVVGNYLGKIRSNWFFGIRTPWTLSSELSWSRTHRLGGRLFVAFGVLVIIAGLAAPVIGVYVVAGGAVALSLALAGYSYLVWRDDPDRSSLGARSR